MVREYLEFKITSFCVLMGIRVSQLNPYLHLWKYIYVQ